MHLSWNFMVCHGSMMIGDHRYLNIMGFWLSESWMYYSNRRFMDCCFHYFLIYFWSFHWIMIRWFHYLMNYRFWGLKMCLLNIVLHNLSWFTFVCLCNRFFFVLYNWFSLFRFHLWMGKLFMDYWNWTCVVLGLRVHFRNWLFSVVFWLSMGFSIVLSWCLMVLLDW